MSAIRVLVVDDHAILRDGLRALLTAAGGIEVVGEADDGFEAVYTRLEGVTKRLEEGGLTLDQTLALYEHGIALSRRAQALLDAAEQRIEVLRQGGD